MPPERVPTLCPLATDNLEVFELPTKLEDFNETITRVVRNLAFARKKQGAISEHFLLIFLRLGQKRAGKKPALNPGTHVSLVKVLAKRFQRDQVV